MILTENVKIKVNINNIDNLKQNGYLNLKFNEFICSDKENTEVFSFCDEFGNYFNKNIKKSLKKSKMTFRL